MTLTGFNQRKNLMVLITNNITTMRSSHSPAEDIEEDPFGLNKYFREAKRQIPSSTLKSFDINLVVIHLCVGKKARNLINLKYLLWTVIKCVCIYMYEFITIHNNR